ncbi:unnamed protein product [Paramecium primaurelia]|uniref:Uncharacterized protein n=2 Tax=Paramecium TaxID=5884 RepID=A0A8S1VS06_9CILI|nr:unnamed protein product [Paramecium primaurelia]CAD8179053.1 unnamed protein product [Paramecium pentaurelia]
MNNIQGYGLDKPSVRLHQAPGGNSSISFGDYTPQQQVPQPLGRKQVNQPPIQQQQQDVKTSVKVRNPPGGRSQIQFG